jgi:hypothetical protein
MNIYQKLKKAGHTTDGLASPLKIDPPKKPTKTEDGGLLPGVTVRAPKKKSLLNRVGHGVLDVAGLVPYIGEAADGANALWYLAEGDKKNAALSAAAMVPFVGMGATGAKFGLKASKLIKNKKIINKVKKALPKNQLKANPNNFYRGVADKVNTGGHLDAIKTGTLRAKPADQIAPKMTGGFNLSKSFSANASTGKPHQLFVTPNLSKAKEYGGVIAEIPKDAANFRSQYKKDNWSMFTTEKIPTEKVKFYKPNPFGGYVLIK